VIADRRPRVRGGTRDGRAHRLRTLEDAKRPLVRSFAASGVFHSTIRNHENRPGFIMTVPRHEIVLS
jgi:hypothetical protein